MTDDNNILKVYGISQNPDTGDYIIVLYYAAGGSFNNWININDNYKSFNWKKKLEILINIAYGLKGIHKRQMFHRDFHIGNILFNTPFIKEYGNRTYISDMGLCGKVGNKDETKIYGIIPYMAPEVLKKKPYTQAADIYSFGMIMYFVVTGRQPFDNCAHNYNLIVDICKGVRPELNELEAPKSYINLMEKCLDLNPNNRPNVNELCQSLYSITLNNSEIEKAENYRILHLSSLMKNRQIAIHLQAIYSSRLLNSYKSESFDCKI
jgi:serine/threonine protein kinase